MYFTTLTTATAMLALTHAQSGPTDKFNSTDLSSLNTTGATTNGVMTSVPLTTRVSWCGAQRTACQTLCGGSLTDVGQNQCDPNALTWDCTCSKNNSEPGLQWYAATLPSNICNMLNGNCMAETASDSDAQSAQANCNATYVCGTLNFSSYSAQASASATPSTSATPSSTAASTTATTSAAHNAAVAAVRMGESYGVGLLAAGLVAAFGYLL